MDIFDIDGLKDVMRKLDETCAAAAKLRARIVEQMRRATAREQPADNDAEVIAARVANSETL